MYRLLFGAALLTATVGCGSEPSGDPAQCQQTYEFGNTGCAELTGRVTDESGQPIAGAYVSVQSAVDSSRAITLVGAEIQTDPSGAYQLRAIRFDGEASSDGPDTVTVWVRAVVPPPITEPVGTSGSGDSVQATLEIRSVGELPAVTQVADIVVRPS